MPYSPILATLGYVKSPDGRRVLMIHRNARNDDHHLGKYNGLGGKLEANEDAAAGMRREIREEAGIECLDLSLRGTISWPGFGKHGEDWFGFLFVITRFSGEPLSRPRWGFPRWPLGRRSVAARSPSDFRTEARLEFRRDDAGDDKDPGMALLS